MAGGYREVPVDGDEDFNQLAGRLDALANPRRLKLLKELAVQRSLRDLRARLSEQRLSHADRGTTITLEAVRKHMVKLHGAGVAHGETDPDSREGAKLWTLDPRGIYLIIEGLRDFLRYGNPTAPWKTREASGFELTRTHNGPHLILLHGDQPGTVYPLDPKQRAPGRGWVIGREPGHAITLDYDPYLSAENTELLPQRDAYTLLDLRTNRNGTYLNFQRLHLGGEAPLHDRDVIGVGRSLLMFRE